MIPPYTEMRLRSIRRWFKDQQPQRFQALTQSGELDAAIQEKDDLMDQTFEEQENEVIARLMREKVWGTQAGMQEFNMLRLMLWGEIREQFLPVTTDSE